MKDKKELLETKLELNDQQLEKVGELAGLAIPINCITAFAMNVVGGPLKLAGMTHLYYQMSIHFKLAIKTFEFSRLRGWGSIQFWSPVL